MRTTVMGVVCIVCLAMGAGCNQNADENNELKAKVIALETENAKLVARLAEIEKQPATLKVPEHIKPFVAEYNNRKLKVSIVGNRVVAEDTESGQVPISRELEGTEVTSLSVERSFLRVSTDLYKYTFILGTGSQLSKTPVQK